MKLKQGIILSPMEDAYVAVAAGDAAKSFSGMVRMNGTAAFICEHMKEETTVDELVRALVDAYEGVSEERARASVERVIAEFSAAGLVE